MISAELNIDDRTEEKAETLKAWMTPIAAAMGAQLLVTGDIDAFKVVADECRGFGSRGDDRIRTDE